jgi:hypothetical protein
MNESGTSLIVPEQGSSASPPLGQEDDKAVLKSAAPGTSLSGQGTIEEALNLWDNNPQIKFADDHPWMIRLGVVTSSTAGSDKVSNSLDLAHVDSA